MEHLCEIILNLDQFFRRLMYKRFHIDSSGSPLVRRSGTICAISVEGIMDNTHAKYFFNLDQWSTRSCHLQQKFMDGQTLHKEDGSQ